MNADIAETLAGYCDNSAVTRTCSLLGDAGIYRNRRGGFIIYNDEYNGYIYKRLHFRPIVKEIYIVTTYRLQMYNYNDMNPDRIYKYTLIYPQHDARIVTYDKLAELERVDLWAYNDPNRSCEYNYRLLLKYISANNMRDIFVLRNSECFQRNNIGFIYNGGTNTAYCQNRLCYHGYYSEIHNNRVIEEYKRMDNRVIYYNRGLCEIEYDAISGEISEYIAHTNYIARK